MAKQSGHQAILGVTPEMSFMILMHSHLSGLDMHHTCLPETKPNDTVIPLNLLLDTFELPQSFQAKLQNSKRLKKKNPKKQKRPPPLKKNK